MFNTLSFSEFVAEAICKCYLYGSILLIQFLNQLEHEHFSAFTGYTTVRNCFRASAIRLLSYQYFTGRTFIALSMFLSLASFGIYVSEASQWPNEIEKCGHKGRTHRLLDFLFNLFFLLHFIIRWAAADNKLVFWVEPFSLLDYCTVPPCLLAFALQRSWMGLRFMRIFRLFNLAEVLHNLNIIKSAPALRFCQLTSFFFAIWLAGELYFVVLFCLQ